MPTDKEQSLSSLWHKSKKDIRLQKYAFRKRWRDFVLTLNAENGSRKIDRQSDAIRKGKRERSFWLCHMQEIYHAPFMRKTWRKEVKKWLYIVDEVEAEKWWHTDWFMNYKTQINYCASIRDDAIKKGRLRTTFYWYNIRKEKNNWFYLY